MSEPFKWEKHKQRRKRAREIKKLGIPQEQKPVPKSFRIISHLTRGQLIDKGQRGAYKKSLKSTSKKPITLPKISIQQKDIKEEAPTNSVSGGGIAMFSPLMKFKVFAKKRRLSYPPNSH